MQDWGSTMAAPIASLIIEKYLTGSVTRKWLEDRILNADFINREIASADEQEN
jgi:penicillin-binding protein 2